MNFWEKQFWIGFSTLVGGVLPLVLGMLDLIPDRWVMICGIVGILLGGKAGMLYTQRKRARR